MTDQQSVDCVYRKRGRVARVENGTLLDIAERGVACERDGTFFCEPDTKRDHLDKVDPGRVLATAEQLRALVPRQVRLERLIVSEGIAEHTIGGATWSEQSERVHLSMTVGVLRLLVDLGSFDVAEVRVAAEALARAEQIGRAAPGRLRLAPPVAAALLPAFVAARRSDIAVVQAGGGLDGMGTPVAEARVDGEAPPNWYRPSYRVRPIRAAMNIAAVSGSSGIDRDVPVALALLESAGGRALRVLVDDGRAVYPCVIPDRPIGAVAPERTWYPYGAGSFGAEMML